MDKSRIGIVTFHRALNYGAQLQAFALMNHLSDRYEVSIVDYRSEFVDDFKKGIVNLKYLIRKTLKFLLFHKYYRGEVKKKRKFIDFSDNYFNLSKPYNTYDIMDCNSEYDIFIAGSDQVWNNRIIKNDWNYFLSFTTDEKKYSYAASFGTTDISDEHKVEIKNFLSKFQVLLLREKTGLNIINDLGIDNERSYCVCDPVFLLDKLTWINKFSLYHQNSQDYILVYIVAKQTNLIEFAKKLARERKLKLKFLNLSGNRHICPKGFENILDAGPIEFLNLIYNAKYVLTTSFHALAFSIIFNIPFYYELNKSLHNNNDRLIHLSEVFNVENKEIISGEYNEHDDYDWKDINCRLKDYKSESIRILQDSLRNYI